MDCEALISYVFVNPPIWDKRLTAHSNRHIVDNCWRKISREMGIDASALRKKWKYLRDQFTVENSKLKSAGSGSTLGERANDPKWPYYKQLMFLKDVVKPRAPPKKFRTSSGSFYEENSEDGLEVDDTNMISIKMEDTSMESDSGSASAHATNSLDISQPVKKRRIADDGFFSEKSELEPPRICSVESTLDRDSENDDLLFFKSLLPYVRKIPVERKLKFRNRIHDIVDDFAHGSQSNGNF